MIRHILLTKLKSIAGAIEAIKPAFLATPSKIKGGVDEALAQIGEYVALVEGKWIEKPVGGSTAGLEFS